MKNVLISAVLIGAAAGAAAQEGDNVPALQPAKPPEAIQAAAAAAPAPAPAPAVTVPAVQPAAVAPIAPATRPAVRSVSAVRNDSIDGLKYAPARRAIDKSTRWANDESAIVSTSGNGKVTFVYGQSVPKLGCSYLRVCAIELEPGETVNKVDAGDPVRWSITPSVVGEAASKTVYVIVKPKSDEPGLYTNLKLATNRRMYEVDIFAVTGEKFVRNINFSYPENDEKLWQAQQMAMAKEQKLVTADMPTMSVDRLHFGYAMDGDSPHRPVRIFDDGDKTYIQMGLNFKNTEAPVLVLLGNDGKEQLVNYRLKNGYFIVDKIFSKAALIVGVGGDQKKVTITRTGGV